MRLAPAPEPDALAARIASGASSESRASAGGRGRFRLPAVDVIPTPGVACPGLGRPGALVLARHRARSPVEGVPGGLAGGLAFWLLALQWLRLLDVGGLTGWIVMSAALFAAGGRSSSRSRAWPSFACDFL